MKLAITGATGFIGGAILDSAIAQGNEVVALVRSEAASRRLAKAGITARQVSLFEPNAIAKAVEDSEILIHAAGITNPRAPAEVLRWTIVAGTENVLNAARHAGLERAILVSSSDVTLGDVDRVHWDEKRDLPHPPVGARARALRLAEEIALSASDSSFKITAIRPGWVWGPNDYSTLPHLIREARRGGIAMYGDGRNLVATTYIASLAQAILAAARSPNVSGQAYHIGDPEFLELREFLGLLARTLDLPKPRSGPPRWLAYPLAKLGRGAHPAEEILKRSRSTLFDVQKAIAELDFRATVSVDQGMKELAQWAESVGGLNEIVARARPAPGMHDLPPDLAAAR